jgi:hypothetical protein
MQQQQKDVAAAEVHLAGCLLLLLLLPLRLQV